MNASLRERRKILQAWLLNSAFPIWFDLGADRVRGGFHEALELDGRHVRADRRARVQTRQIYCYAHAAELGWAGDAGGAAEHGLTFFLSRYARGDGLYRTFLGTDGRQDCDDAWLYDQAFALLAFGGAARHLTSRTDLSAHAAAVRSAIENWRSAAGGFREASRERTFQSNPHMHLLEAALLWRDLDPHAWDPLVDEIGELALSRFIDGNGALHEFFSDDWSLAPGLDGRVIEPGHQFEWAWLLERWARLRARDDAHRASVRLFEIATRHGVDPLRGVAFDQMLDDFMPHRVGARLWPQTERLKAALILAEGEDEKRAFYLAEAEKAAAGLQRYLEVPLEGLWRDKMTPSGTFLKEPAPASSFYHIVCAILELRRLTPEPTFVAEQRSPI